MLGNYLSWRSGTRAVVEEVADRLEAAGTAVIRSSRFSPGLLRGCDLVASALGVRGDYDVASIELYSGRAFLWGELAGRACEAIGRPFVYVLHGGGLPHFARKKPSRVRRALGRAYAVCSPSPFLARALEPYRPDIRQIPNPIDISRYAFRRRSPVAPKLVWIRAFESVYNPTLAVDAVARVTKAHPAVTLTMFGPVKDWRTFHGVRERIARLNLQHVVELAGPLNKADVPATLARYDILLNTPDVDNTPVSVIEAMACGLCVVSTDVGGLPWLLEADRTALLVPAGDARGMAGAVCRLLSNEKLCTLLSENGRHKVEKFDWAYVLPEWKALLSTASGWRRQ
jgi:glycosyltransferase involved in cell wall biosynthesis